MVFGLANTPFGRWSVNSFCCLAILRKEVGGLKTILEIVKLILEIIDKTLSLAVDHRKKQSSPKNGKRPRHGRHPKSPNEKT